MARGDESGLAGSVAVVGVTVSTGMWMEVVALAITEGLAVGAWPGAGEPVVGRATC